METDIKIKHEESRSRLRKRLRRRIRQQIKEKKFEADLDKIVGVQKARVRQIHVDGLDKTQDWLVQKAVADLLQVQTFGDVLLTTKNVHNELKKLGCFQTVDVFIDKNADHDKDVDIHFTVEELPNAKINYAVETGDDEGVFGLGTLMPNLMGAGEKVQTLAKVGSKGTQQVSVDFLWPLRNNLLWNR